MNDIIITTTTSPQQQQQQHPLLLPWLFLLLTPSCSKPMKIMIPTSSICVQLQPLSTLSPLSHLITFKVRTHTHAHHLPLFKCNSKSIHVYFYFILIYMKVFKKQFVTVISDINMIFFTLWLYNIASTVFICNIRNHKETVISTTI